MFLPRLFFICLLIVSFSAEAVTLKVAVAANFAPTLKAVLQAYQQHSPRKFQLIVSSTGQLYRQIRQGAPYDLFLAADDKHPQSLAKAGLVENLTPYALGRLVLYSPSLLVNQNPLDVLKRKNYRHLALANPRYAPYGQAAKAFLQKYHLWQHLQPYLVMGSSIGTTAQYVATANAQLGFLAFSQVKDPKGPFYQKGYFYLIDPKDYPPLVQVAAIVSTSPHKKAARDFLHFLTSPQAHLILKNYAYGIPQPQ